MSGRKLLLRHKKFKYSRKGSLAQASGLYKKFDPMGGAPMAAGIVIRKKNVDVKQPHSGLRKCAVVQLIKNGRTLTAHMPGNGALKFIDEHDTVLVQRIGAPYKGAKGDMPGVKFKIIAVSSVSLPELIKGKKEKVKK